MSDELLNAFKFKGEGRLLDALQASINFIAANSTDAEGRLLYANLLYDLGCQELAAEQVHSLYKRYPERKSIKQLLAALDPQFSGASDSGDSPKPDSSVLAEAELDFSDIEEL